MKKEQAALAAIEFKSVPAGLYAADALMKKAPIAMLKAGTIGCGKYFVVFTGTTASVEEAREEGLFEGGLQVADELLLPDIHEDLYAALAGEPMKMGEGALFVLETPSVATCLLAVERMLKGVPVRLVELRLGDPRMAGKGLAIVQGELFDVEAAQDIALGVTEGRGVAAQSRLLSAPTPFILQQIASSTRFDRVEPVRLDGETAS